MTGEERREGILERIRQAKAPVAARALAELYGVSRQVIVQDIALIRASGHEIFSTNRGYILLQKEKPAVRIFKVCHTDEQLEDELLSIVDLGGCVENVVVNHKVYGRLEAYLGVDSRRRVQDFLEELRSGKSSPLKNITSGYHYHEIRADREETLDMIGKMLAEKGFLVEEAED